MNLREHGLRCACGGLLLAGLALSAGAAHAEDGVPAPASPTAVDTITVTATRVPAPGFEVPAQIDVIDGGEFNEDRLGVNLSEGLAGVPGVLARDRQNYAQDTQISIRGFGSRATFGIRGLRLYLDGIPATQPDGQGQIAHFNLASAERVEILRGPFSTLYGNSSGGVIQMFTRSGRDAAALSGGTAFGSFDTWRANLGSGGSLGLADYLFDYTHFETGGFRDHSSARRESFNGKLDLNWSPQNRSTVLLNLFSSPDTEDPLGLTRAQFDQDSSQATPQAEMFDTRKSTDQNQVGLVHEFDLNVSNSLHAAAYYGTREVEQFLAITTGAQAAPRSAGGVVDLESGYGGADLRWSFRSRLGGRPLTLVAGLTYDALSQDRRGYNNFVGTELGVRGDLRRDEVNDIDNFDQYAQASLELSDRWTTLVGLRHSRVEFESDDKFVSLNDPDNPNDDNPDDSGKTGFSATTPVAGLLFRFRPSTHFYAAYGRGFETPTFAEAAYRPDGGSGLNFALDAARTDNAEVGAKLRLGAQTRAQLALFHADTEDELVVATNAGGRSTFQNAGRTRRRGVEMQVQTRLLDRLDATLAWTWIEAEVREVYNTCTGPPPCTVANTTVPKGNRLPGVPESSLHASLAWKQGETGWHAGIEARVLDAVPVNDTNIESAPSYNLIGLDGGYVYTLPAGRLRAFVRVDNLFDEEYIGSVIVNDGNGRFFEPGPELNVLAGLRWDWKP